MSPLSPADRPTFYFIGVTTAQSSIMKVFPRWAEHWGLGDVVMKGIDFPLHAPPEDYRQAVSFLKHDPKSLGALVTTHKLDLYAACKDMFDEIDPYARIMDETSCLSKRDGRFICHAKDPITSGLTIERMLPANHFASTRADMLAMGAGGSTIAMTCYLMQPERGANRPSRIVVTDRSQARLDEIARIHRTLDLGIPCEYRRVDRFEDNDALLASMKPGAFVVNATGLGKDAPGSPLSDAAVFPVQSIAWDLNYRGDLKFLQQARAQAASRRLQVEDGWTYFLYGWTRVIAEVFDIEIPVDGPEFDVIGRIAAQAGKPAS